MQGFITRNWIVLWIMTAVFLLILPSGIVLYVFDNAQQYWQNLTLGKIQPVKIMETNQYLSGQSAWILLTLIFCWVILAGFGVFMMQQQRALFTSLQSKYALDTNEKIGKITHFVEQIGSGNLEINLETTEQDHLSDTLNAMRDKLKEINIRDHNRRFINEGIAQATTLLRNQTTNDEQIYHDILAFIINYLQANQGALFIATHDQLETQTKLEMSACYAYNKRKYMNRSVAPGEGLIGQVYLEKEYLYLTQVPQGYVSIRSGLGEATPGCLMVSPLIYNDKVFGILEIASFKPLESHYIEFVNSTSQVLASTISALQTNRNTRMLLEETQMQTEQMRAQEEEMRQNMEELQATQEEMNRKNSEMEQLFEQSIAKEQEAIAAKIAVEDTQQNFARMTDNVPGMIYQFLQPKDSPSSFPFTSKGIRTVFEVAHGYFDQVERFIAMINPEDLPSFNQSIADAVAKGRIWQWEGRFVLPNGKLKWISGTAKPEALEDGAILFSGIFNDITEVKSMEVEMAKQSELLSMQEQLEQSMEEMQTMQEALIQSENYIKGIVEALSYSVITVNPDGLIKTYNRASEKLLGYSPDEAIGILSLADLNNPDDIKSLAQSLSDEYGQQVQAGFEAFTFLPDSGKLLEREMNFITKNKQKIITLLTVSGITDRQGNTTAYVSIAQDISERKEIEAQLRESQEEILQQMEEMKTTQELLYDNMKTMRVLQTSVSETENRSRAFLDKLTVATLIADASGKVTAYNNVFAALTGFDAAVIQAKDLTSALIKPTEIENNKKLIEDKTRTTLTDIAEIFAQADPDTYWTLNTKAGQTISCQIKTHLLVNRNKKIIGFALQIVS